MFSIGPETSPSEWLSAKPTVAEIDAIVAFLEGQGTFNFPRLSTGLFSAAAAEENKDSDIDLTGYQNVWVRDNIHVAHAMWVLGETEMAVNVIDAITEFYVNSRDQIVLILEGGLSTEVQQNRPHIRFDGDTLKTLEEGWSHAQNDALGYFLWLSGQLLNAGELYLDEERFEVLNLLVRYLAHIEFWHDRDSGHWEEARKIEASSIGTALAGLLELKAFFDQYKVEDDDPQEQHEVVQLSQILVQCIDSADASLSGILPNECIEADRSLYREYDSALLFLAYPLNVVDDVVGLKIVNNVRDHLMGPIGIRRYIGDSYWCANYRDLLSAETRTSDFSDDMSARDALLKPDEEAQWCLFDPIISIIYGQRFQSSGDEQDRERQWEHLRRSLSHLTSSESRFEPFRCPESYFLEKGKWIPNDICPLLWTQANLRLALHFARKSVT